MKSNEFVVERVTRANTIADLRLRVEKVAAICDPIADLPLLFREFRTGINYDTLIAKVENKTDQGNRAPKLSKSGSAGSAQANILDLLGIENPVFTVMSPPTSTFGFHGDPHIFIPPPGSSVVWSPKIKDLGGQLLAGDKSLGRKKVGPGAYSTTSGVMNNQMMKWASTYKSGYPVSFTNHEIIFDCEFYYLLNIKSFLNNFAGKENKSMIVARPHGGIHKDFSDKLFSTVLKNYGDVAHYMRNTVPSYLNWYQQQYPLTP